MNLEVIDARNVSGNEIVTYGNQENPLFLAKDVATWIGYEVSNVSKMVKNIDEDERIITRINNTNATFLTEDGLYEVLMQSRKPIAKQFKKEIKKILKQIRQTGGYIPHSEEDDDDTILAKALLVANKTIERNKQRIKNLEKETIKLVEVIEKQQPRLDYLDKILECDNALLVTSIAFDYGLSAIALNKILAEEKVQRNVRGQWILYSDYQGKGYTQTETKEHNGHSRIQTLWTQKGRMLIHNIMSKRNITATYEQETLLA